MRQVTAAGNRFRQAHGLPAVLDAACGLQDAGLVYRFFRGRTAETRHDNIGGGSHQMVCLRLGRA